jgi:hypothetical protein
MRPKSMHAWMVLRNRRKYFTRKIDEVCMEGLEGGGGGVDVTMTITDRVVASRDGHVHNKGLRKGNEF